MFNEEKHDQNDFAEIVNIQQTLFRNLKSNHRFYVIYAFAGLPFWLSFVILAVMYGFNRSETTKNFFYLIPILFCAVLFLYAQFRNIPLVVKGSNHLRAINKTRTQNDEPVKFLPGIAQYVSSMYTLISNPTFPKRRKDKISSKRARDFEVSYIIQFIGFFVAIAIVPIGFGISEPSNLAKLNFIIPYVFLILFYVFLVLISIKVIRNLKDWQLLFTELDVWGEYIEDMSIEELNE